MKFIVNKALMFLCLMLFVVIVSSCEKDEKWEYKVIRIEGNEGYNGNYSDNFFVDPSYQLNVYGKDGWELVTSYTEIETVHPNFGNKEYVTGLQPNTRTHRLNFVLKRKLKDENDE